MNHQLIVALLAAGGVTVVDWGLGIIVSLKPGGGFSVQKLPGQLVTMILPYLGGSGVLVVFQGWAQQYVGGWAGGTAPNIVTGVAYTALGTYALKVLADIWNKFGALIPEAKSPTPAPAATPPFGQPQA